MTATSTFAGRAMGSPLRLQVTGVPVEGTARPESLWQAAVDEFAAVDAALSCYRPDSDLSRLNGTAGSGMWRPASRRLYAFLATAERARRVTKGQFDPRVLPDLARLGHPGLVVPMASASRAGTPRREEVGWLDREPRTRSVRIRSAADSGGLGKGLALRWAGRHVAARLAGRGALLEAGGDITGWGRAPDGQPWQIGIEDPGGATDPLAVISLSNGAVCTSSIARQRWIAPDGRAVHHLVDPRTGEPGGEGLQAVTVGSDDPAWAEVWSKALFLEGPQRIGEVARRLGLAAWWIEADGTLRMTPAARQRTTWTR